MCQDWNQQKYGEVHELRKRDLRHVIFVQSLDIHTNNAIMQMKRIKVSFLTS